MLIKYSHFHAHPLQLTWLNCEPWDR